MKWRTLEAGKISVQYCGTLSAAETVVKFLRETSSDLPTLARKLGEIPEHYAVVGRTSTVTCAVVDHIRSVPIFWRYTERNSGPLVGPDAHILRTSGPMKPFASNELCEVAMTGYVTGPNTLISGLSQLEAGEVRYWQHHLGTTENAFSYRHWPSNEFQLSSGSEYEQLSGAINASFARTMNFAGTRPILVPLSGGLDSRLVLGKLVEHGYSPLHAFSYGPPNNPDAETARLVAERLGVQWRHVQTPTKRCRAFFDSDILKRYWDFSDGLCCTPNHQDLLPLITLTETGEVPENSVLVNGQTGDFITGGHIPDAFNTDATVNTNVLIEEIIAKHYGLWKNLMTSNNLLYAHKRISACLDMPETPTDISATQAAALYELWEYKERQAKYVVNGQRIYDFLGMDWSLPLWDREFTTFWRDTKISHKYKQSLYRTWLQQWNYRGIFTDIDNTITAWPRVASSILACAAIAMRLVTGRKRRDQIFRYLNYFDRFGDHYKIFGFHAFWKHAKNLRNPTSMYTKSWLEYHGVSLDSLVH